ncbi:hypothetical protein BRADI_3g18972v3, partial [Brachypodium distachyon]
RKGLSSEATCALWDQELETIDHLLLWCLFYRSLWLEVLSIFGWGLWMPSALDTLKVWWFRVLSSLHGAARNKAGSIILLLLQEIWLERNSRIFRNLDSPVHILLDAIRFEVSRWKEVGLLRE